jgi:hypothetical protein
MKYFLLCLKLLALLAFLVSAFFAGRLFEQWTRLASQPIASATTTPTPYVPPLPEGGAYVKCTEWNDYHIECYPGERYEKTTQLEGVSMDVFVTKNKVKELEKHGEFEIYYLKKK